MSLKLFVLTISRYTTKLKKYSNHVHVFHDKPEKIDTYLDSTIKKCLFLIDYNNYH